MGTSGKVDQAIFFKFKNRWHVIAVANAHCLLWDVGFLEQGDDFMRNVEWGSRLDSSPGLVWKTQCGSPEHDLLCVSEDCTRAFVSG